MTRDKAQLHEAQSKDPSPKSCVDLAGAVTWSIRDCPIRRPQIAKQELGILALKFALKYVLHC